MCSAQQRLLRKVDSLVANQRSETTETYLYFKSTGKEAIPYLVNVIDQNEKGYIGFAGDSTSSTILGLNYNYCGMRAAFMIEYILSPETVNPKNVFNIGAIVKLNSKNEPLISLVTIQDMKEIKKIFREWWEKNKSRTLQELQAEWNKGISPLSNSNYTWK